MLCFGCAQVTGLNMRRHQFGRQPTKIIWFQVAGLNHEQLAMLRFGFPSSSDKTALESAVCVGQAWSFNLYKLRPTVHQSMMSQVTGKKDLAGTCEDWNLKPLWDYLDSNSYKTGILEVDSRQDESLLGSVACGEKPQGYLSETILWLMRAENPLGAESYLPAVNQDYRAGKVYWDKTCNAQGCGSGLRMSLGSIYRHFSKNASKHMLLIRDFTLIHALERKNFVAAREALREIDKTAESFYQASDDRDDMLVLVSGAGSVDIDFPAEGKDWQKFDLRGEGALPRRGELISPVFAHGARAENFCGIFEESQMFERVLSGPKQQGLELKIINPFK